VPHVKSPTYNAIKQITESILRISIGVGEIPTESTIESIRIPTTEQCMVDVLSCVDLLNVELIREVWLLT
jgi:hypothetical protein